MHRINKMYADGVISVSRYIDKFYRKEGCPSVIIPPLFDEPDLIKNAIGANEVPIFLYAGTPFEPMAISFSFQNSRHASMMLFVRFTADKYDDKSSITSR